MKRLLLALLIALPVAVSAQDDAVTAALKQAQARHEPVLIDFHAPWCYSCYYMQVHVLNGSEWQGVRRDTVTVELDADSPEGAHWMKQWNVKALPAYVVLDAKGEELGRILAEQTRADFYRRLDAILAHDQTLPALQAKVTGSDAASLAALRAVLEICYARRDADGGLAWYAKLPAPVRNAGDHDDTVSFRLDRLRLLRAAAAKDATACVAAGERVLAGPLGCERPYDLDTVMDCAAQLPADQQQALYRQQRPALEALVAKGAFGKPRCADQRSIVLTAADLDHALGDTTAEKNVLDCAIADTRRKLGDDARKDRNLADNLRVYLERAGRMAEYDAWLQKLIAAYPDDYVYPYRLGKSLLQRGQAAQSLPYLQQAAGLAYGENRLVVATLRVQALKQLKRDDEARRVAADALKANGPWFPDEVAKLKALAAS